MSNQSTSTSDKQQVNSPRATRPSDEQARRVYVLPQFDTDRTVTGDSVGLEIAGGGHGSDSEVMTHSQVDVSIAAELAGTGREFNPMDVYGLAFEKITKC